MSVLLSAAAVVVSVIALIFSRRSWLETYRPIITVRVTTHSGGNQGITFNLVVNNVGNRPATNIRLKATPEAIDKLVQSGGRETYRKEIEKCFSEYGVIPVLAPGKSVKNGFGLTHRDPDQDVLNYDASAEITVEYGDLDTRSYSSRMNILVRDSAYFAGSGWSDAK